MSAAVSRLRTGLRTIWFMFALTALFGAAVSALQVYTQPLVARNATLFLKRAVRAAAGLPPLADAALLAWYTNAVTALPPGAEPPACYRVRAAEEGEAPAYVFVRSGAGLWGRITAAVGVAAEAQRFTGLAIVDQNETPGLGARIAEPWFAAQVRDKEAPLTLRPEKSGATDARALDAITGATITSTAVRDLLNRAMGESAGVIRDAEGSQSDGHR